MSTQKPRTWVKMFQLGFVPKVLSGAKLTTIRTLPKRPQDWPSLWDLIDARHWSGKPYRSSQVKIMTARINQVRRIEILPNELRFAEPDGELASAWNAGNRTGAMMLDAVAHRDGFDSWEAMVQWFQTNHGLPFAGILIEWDRNTISPGPARADRLGASPSPDVSTGVGGATMPDGEYLAGVMNDGGHAVATNVRITGGRIFDASGTRVRNSEIKWFKPDLKDLEIAKLRSEIARLRSELAENLSELVQISRNPPEVRCQELAEMVFQGLQRHRRLFDRIDELKTAGAALDFSLIALGSRQSRPQIAWRRVLRKKPSAYQPTQPTTPSH